MASVSLSCSATSLRAATVAREGHARRADRGQRYRGRVFSARPGASHRGEASTSTSSDDLDDLISAVASGARDLTRSEIDRLTSELNLTSLCDAACAARAAGPDPGIVTFSPKVFVPLTFACRDRCGYCTFAKDPEAGSKIYMSLEQVIEVAERGRVAGATECLFTLGDRPVLNLLSKMPSKSQTVFLACPLGYMMNPLSYTLPSFVLISTLVGIPSGYFSSYS